MVLHMYKNCIYFFRSLQLVCLKLFLIFIYVGCTILCLMSATSTTGYTRKSGIIILLYFVLTSPHSSITTLLVNFGRSFSFRSTTTSYTDFVSLVPSDKRCYVERNDRYEVGVRDKKHENSLPLDLHRVKFERISRIFDPTF